uniref:Rho GTPase-activating protein REN1-like n=1 Tax=Kalanchoe fedtschenkoi TaxID=63787 RepID=A0A7N0UVS5_KALFE
MVNRNTDVPQGDINAPQPSPGPQSGPTEHSLSRTGNKVFKSGPLYISSKGIGWTSWKKRWFILTRTSLVFFRSDPSVTPQKGGEVNLTLGGIDLNNSGSVIVKLDKKLLTVQFPDGRDGRTFTLKAETLEELHEWKEALESALAQAPSASLVMGQNGILNKEQTDAATPAADSPEKSMGKEPAKSTIIGRPVLLALEEVDGSPSFLEKALRFIEEHGVKVEGILRQSASVDDVESRIREYEQGKCEFSTDEDAHVIGDCIKYVLRELPSSPVPASCCNALVEARRADRGNRVKAMCIAICETFPEPNRRLLQRILNMMQKVVSHKNENRMSVSAVAACMAPLLLRPLLAGDCELESDFDVGGDGSIQLLQAAAAANHAQAIVITLMEEYDNIFGMQEGYISPGLYTDSEESGTGSEEISDEEGSYEDEEEEEEDHSGSNISDVCGDEDDDFEHSSAASCSGSGGSQEKMHGDKVPEVCSLDSKSLKLDDEPKDNKESLVPQLDEQQRNEIPLDQTKQVNELDIPTIDVVKSVNKAEHVSVIHSPTASIMKSTTLLTKPDGQANPRSGWGRTSARKNLSMESIDYGIEEDEEVQKLEAAKRELQNKIADEAQKNAILLSSLEKRKEALQSRRLALEQEVARLQEQLQKECELRATLEAILESRGAMPASAVVDDKTKAGLEEIAKSEAAIVNLEQKVDDLGNQLSEQHDLSLQAPSQGKSKDRHNGIFDRGSRSKGHRDDHSDAVRAGNERQESSSLQNQGSNNTTSALSKLTTRLNFLKERRTQIANELLDKSRSSGRSAESQEVSDSETISKLSGSSESVQNPEAGSGKQDRSNSKKEKHKKLDGKSSSNDRGKKSDGSVIQNVEKNESGEISSRQSEKLKSQGRNHVGT